MLFFLSAADALAIRFGGTLGGFASAEANGTCPSFSSSLIALTDPASDSALDTALEPFTEIGSGSSTTAYRPSSMNPNLASNAVLVSSTPNEVLLSRLSSVVVRGVASSKLDARPLSEDKEGVRIDVAEMAAGSGELDHDERGEDGSGDGV